MYLFAAHTTSLLPPPPCSPCARPHPSSVPTGRHHGLKADTNYFNHVTVKFRLIRREVNHAKFDNLECHCHVKFSNCSFAGAQQTQRARQRSPCKNWDIYIQTFWFEAVPNLALGLGIARLISRGWAVGFPAARFDFQQFLDLAI